MRTIKFRGKRVENGEWVYGYYLRFRYEPTGGDFVNAKEGDFIFPFGGDESDANYEVQPETVGQFTGLTDKEGKEIYEGDIVEVVNDDMYSIHRKEIEYIESSARFHAIGTYCENLYEYTHSVSGRNISSIIGNIQDNPELLDK